MNPAAASIAHTFFGFEPSQIYTQLCSQQPKIPDFSKDVNYIENETPSFAAGGLFGITGDFFEPCINNQAMEIPTLSYQKTRRDSLNFRQNGSPDTTSAA